MIKQISLDNGKLINHYKTAFISDIHLSLQDCQVDDVLFFINNNHFDNIFIVGDFIDGWTFKTTGYWHQGFTDIISKLLKKTRYGTKITYLIGNHDEFLDNFLNDYGNVEIKDNVIYEINKNKILILHGHQVDPIMVNTKWIGYLGNTGYLISIHLNKVIAKIRKILRLKPWSLSDYAKASVKKAMDCLSNQKNVIRQYAIKNKVDGIICGHTHDPMLDKNPPYYFNTGDFVSHSTAIVEDFDNTVYLIQYKNKTEKIIDQFTI